MHQPKTPAGERIEVQGGQLKVPDHPIIPFVEGDGIGPDIWAATKQVLDSAVEKSYEGKREIVWTEILAGEKAQESCGEWLPEATVESIKLHKVAIKGPLTTPVGGGFRSLNVALRHLLDLYACVRPVRWTKGVPSPVHRPQDMDMIIFRDDNSRSPCRCFPESSTGTCRSERNPARAARRFLENARPAAR